VAAKPTPCVADGPSTTARGGGHASGSPRLAIPQPFEERSAAQAQAPAAPDRLPPTAVIARPIRLRSTASENVPALNQLIYGSPATLTININLTDAAGNTGSKTDALTFRILGPPLIDVAVWNRSRAV